MLTELVSRHAEVFVRGAFRLILLREPDASGLTHCKKALTEHHDPRNLLEALKGSPERTSSDFGKGLGADRPLTHHLTFSGRRAYLLLKQAAESGDSGAGENQ